MVEKYGMFVFDESTFSSLNAHLHSQVSNVMYVWASIKIILMCSTTAFVWGFHVEYILLIPISKNKSSESL